MTTRSRAVLMVMSVGFSAVLTQSQTPSRPAPVIPVLTELTADLNAAHLHPGSMVSVRVMAEWKGPGCTLARGSILEALVTALLPPSRESKDFQLALSFDKAPCADAAMEPYTLILIDVASPQDHTSAALAMPNPIGNGVGSGSFRSALSDNAEAAYDMQYMDRFKEELRPGRVYGVKGMTMKAAAGPRDSSILISMGHGLFLNKHTLFLLVPKVVFTRKSEGEIGAAKTTSDPASTNPQPK